MDVIVELSRLEQLRAFGCTALTDTALIKLSQHPALKSIELGCNSHFSNRGIAALANLQSAYLQAFFTCLLLLMDIS